MKATIFSETLWEMLLFATSLYLLAICRRSAAVSDFSMACVSSLGSEYSMTIISRSILTGESSGKAKRRYSVENSFCCGSMKKRKIAGADETTGRKSR